MYIFWSLYHFTTIEVQFLTKFVLVKSGDNSHWNISVLLRKSTRYSLYSIDNFLNIERNNENMNNKDKHKLFILWRINYSIIFDLPRSTIHHVAAFNHSNIISRNNYPTIYPMKRVNIMKKRLEFEAHYTWMCYGMKSSNPVSFSWSPWDLFVPWRKPVCCLVPGWDKKGTVDNRLTVMHDFFEIRISWIRGLPWVLYIIKSRSCIVMIVSSFDIFVIASLSYES